MKEAVLLQVVSAASSVTSGAFDLCDLNCFSVGVNFSGSNVAGTLKLMASLDNTTYFDVASSSQAVTSSTDHVWDVTQCGYRYVKANWVYTSGTGNIDIKIFVKEPVVKIA